MEFWLQRDASKFRLPIPPSSYNSDLSNAVVTQTNVKGDDINQFTGKKLGLYQLEFMIPSYRGKYECEVGWTYGNAQIHVMNLLKAWTDRQILIEYLVIDNNSQVKINTKVIIESYSFMENDGSGDVTISLAMREMKYVSSVKATASNIKSNRPRISAGSPVA